MKKMFVSFIFENEKKLKSKINAKIQINIYNLLHILHWKLNLTSTSVWCTNGPNDYIDLLIKYKTQTLSHFNGWNPEKLNPEYFRKLFSKCQVLIVKL